MKCLVAHAALAATMAFWSAAAVAQERSRAGIGKKAAALNDALSSSGAPSEERVKIAALASEFAALRSKYRGGPLGSRLGEAYNPRADWQGNLDETYKMLADLIGPITAGQANPDVPAGSIKDPKLRAKLQQARTVLSQFDKTVPK